VGIGKVVAPARLDLGLALIQHLFLCHGSPIN
jgi:hypothetical protein